MCPGTRVQVKCAVWGGVNLKRVKRGKARLPYGVTNRDCTTVRGLETCTRQLHWSKTKGVLTCWVGPKR